MIIRIAFAIWLLLALATATTLAVAFVVDIVKFFGTGP